MHSAGRCLVLALALAALAAAASAQIAASSGHRITGHIAPAAGYSQSPAGLSLLGWSAPANPQTLTAANGTRLQGALALPAAGADSAVANWILYE